jgi:hypothetical protein
VAKVIADPEAEFEEELQAFDNDVDVAIQCFYTWQAVHTAARKSRKVYDLLNRNAAFWVLALGSIQANSLIALGRVFDKDNRSHNVSRLLKLAEENPTIFSKAAVRRRKNKDLANASHLVDDFMSNVKEPLALDFQRLRSFADARRKVYERCYKQLRDKVYAHKDRSDISAFVAKTNTLELGRLISDLRILHGVLWHWLRNGRAPRLSPLRHSAGKQITRDTRKFLKSLVSGSSV